MSPTRAPTRAGDSYASRAAFELRCADVHPSHCETSLRASTPGGLIVAMREHGNHAHGFTSAWYTARRLTVMTEAMRRHDVPAARPSGPSCR